MEQNSMRSSNFSASWTDLVKELEVLESFFPQLLESNLNEELIEEILEIESLIAEAGEPDDEQSTKALVFLNEELARKKLVLDEFRH